MPNRASFYQNFLLIALVAALFLAISRYYLNPSEEKCCLVVRAAVDIGSGATKLKVAEVDLKNNKIVRILINENFAVPYQETLEKSEKKEFTEKVMKTGLDALKKSRDIAQKYGAQKVVAIATASFRKAQNSEAFTHRIYEETGIKVEIVDQELEGKLAFQATAAQVSNDPADLIVWDIGGGSFQFTAKDAKGDYAIYRGHEASVPFKNMIIWQIQKRDPHLYPTPNPLTAKEIDQGTELARKIAQKVDRFFQEKIGQPQTKVIGVGNIFAYNIPPLINGQTHFTQKQLSEAVKALAGKTDKDLGGGDFANVAVSNPLLILGFMQTLHISHMDILDINGADGALIYEPFWKATSSSLSAKTDREMIMR